VALWKEWIFDTHRSGNHGYDCFMPRIGAKCALMPELDNPEHFQPLGASAATTSYSIQ
jgi:hypothetical protein